MSERCPWAIRFGVTLTTRCYWVIGHDGPHEGKGLAEFAYQRVSWLRGDRREFLTERTDEHAWDDSGRPARTPEADA